MAVDISVFDDISPSRFITFTIPNPSSPSHLLRIAVLDSPVHPSDSAQVAQMFVPTGREHDWVFCTESGHLQLLLSSPQISRLILIGNNPTDDTDSPVIYYKNDAVDYTKLEQSVRPLVTALSRNFCFKNGIYDVPVLSYEDNVMSSVVLEKCVGSFVGEMLVEDVRIESDESECEYTRRLRFRRMPNLIQTEIKIVPKLGLDEVSLGEFVKFRPDTGVLVHVYLVPMVASCALVAHHLSESIRLGFRPRALCLGVGGGALVSFMGSQLGFMVLGIEIDEQVLRVGRRYFGLEDGEFVQVCTGDGIEFIQELASRACDKSLGACDMQDGKIRSYEDGLGAKFDVIMVDLDSDDVRNGVTAPPLEFVRKDVLLAARKVLSDFGILVVNVIPPDKLFYNMLLDEFRKVFHELYEIDIGNGENFVLIASVSPIVPLESDCENTFYQQLRSLIPLTYMDSIRKI